MTARDGEAGLITAPAAIPWYDAVSVPWLLAVLMRGRRTIAALAILGFASALVVALMRPTYYTSSFSFIPQNGSDQARGGLASLAGQMGISVGALTGQGPSPQLYADLLQTHEILAVVAHDTVPDGTGQRVPLPTLLRVNGANPAILLENTVRALRDRVITTSVAARTTGMVTVDVRTRSAGASFVVAQQLLDRLNAFNIATRKSQAGEERRFVEQQLADARGALRRAEDSLQGFLQGNRAVGAPDLAFQRDRLQRAVSQQQQLVTGLEAQYEDARIREVRDTPVITVLEHPRIPVLPDPGGRAGLVLLGTFAALLIGVAVVVARAGWARQRAVSASQEPYEALSAEWRAMRERQRRS